MLLQDIQDAVQQAEVFVEEVWAAQKPLERLAPPGAAGDGMRRLLDHSTAIGGTVIFDVAYV